MNLTQKHIRKFAGKSARILLLAIAFPLGSRAAGESDTLRYTVQEAETVFLEHNLSLMAEKLNISQGDARILQAKAWPNPHFTLDQIQTYINAGASTSPAFFGNFWRDRTVSAQLEQLVRTAGKRRKNIDLEVRNKELAQIAFTDLLLALKAEFRQTAWEIGYLQQVQDGWQLQLTEVEKLLRAQQVQLQQGNISQAEAYRLKALSISLRGEINDLGEQMSEKQASLKTLMYLNPSSYIIIRDSTNDAQLAKLKAQNLSDLMNRAEHNTALQAAQGQVNLSMAQLRIEKANRVPDLTFSANYDRNGSTQLDFVGVGVAMDLPFFDRNKGNIRAAKLELDKSRLMEQNKRSEVQNNLFKAWTDLNRSVTLYESIDKDYVQKLNDMTKAIAKNFSQHNISLLEFLDYFSSFRDSREQYYQAIRNIAVKKEDLNYLLGGEL
jgi:cobalt-zinc-cadmium efflux system outer membrane protein